MEDKEIIKRLRSKNYESAFEELLRKYSGIIKSVAFKILGYSEAEDISQEVFLKVYNKRSKFSPKGSLKNWICKMARNKALDSLKMKNTIKRGGGKVVSLDNLVESDDMFDIAEDSYNDPKNYTERMELDKIVRDKVKEAPYSYRQLIFFRFSEDMGYSKIAKEAEIPRRSIDNKLKKAEDLLASKLIRYVA